MDENDESHADYVQSNREIWNAWADPSSSDLGAYVESGHRAWREDQPHWGVFQTSESEVGLLRDFKGGDVVELGCGTAYVSAWLARRGGNPVGVDNSPVQLSTAASFQKEFNLDFPLIFGDAEKLPLRDNSFDFAISEYGAAIWCDPYRWIPEAARVLRPEGQLVVFGNSVLLTLCGNWEEDSPATERLRNSLFGMHRFEDASDKSVQFHIPHGEQLRLFRSCGFEVEDLIEVKPSRDTEETKYSFVDLEWANKWPAEEAWIVRKK